MELAHLPCPYEGCGSSDAFTYNEGKKVGYCHSCGTPYPSRLKMYDWAKSRYPTKDNKTPYNEAIEEDMKKEYRDHRGITTRTMEFYDVQTEVDESGKEIRHGYKYPDGKTKYRIFPKAFSTDPGLKTDSFWGMNRFNGGAAKAVTICEGELDAMSAFQMLGSKYPAVSLPSATPKRTILENCYEWLNSFEKIYLSLDTDDKAENFAISLMNLFPGRVYKVNHDKYKDANEFLQAGAATSYQNAWYNARLYTPSTILANPEDFLELYEDTQQHNYIPTGIPELDAKILGLMQGHFTVLLAETGIGKSLAPDTPVLRYDGQVVKAIDVNVGDFLMGPDSKPRKVTNVNVQRGPMYEITPVKGESFKCNADHILSLKNTTTKEIKNVVLLDYLNWSKTEKHLWKLWRSPVDFNTYSGSGYGADLAYCVGAYLGDGREQGPEISMGKKKQPVIDYMLGTYLQPSRVNFSHGAYYFGFSKKSLLWQEVVKAVRPVRHIPDLIKLNSKEDRQAVLAGLLDTDGSLTIGGAEITQKSERLADDICFVARSLGIAAYKKDKFVNGVNYYRVTLSGDLSELPTKRLKFSPRKQIKSVLVTGFSVKYIGEGEYRGIALDGDHLFLLGDFTVTHNTELMRYLQYNLIKNHPDVKFAAWHLEESPLRSLLGLVSYELNDNLTRKDLVEQKGKQKEVKEAIKRISDNGNYVQFSLKESDSVGALIDQIRILSEAYGCRYIFFEPIQDVLSISDEKEKESKLASLSIQLSKMAAKLNVGIVTIAHTNENGDPKYCRMISQRASVRIVLQRDKEASSPLEKNTTYLKVTKNRPCGLEGDAGALTFDHATFTLKPREEGF
jgi:replicative DNA helicase/ribosomal protein L37E